MWLIARSRSLYLLADDCLLSWQQLLVSSRIIPLSTIKLFIYLFFADRSWINVSLSESDALISLNIHVPYIHLILSDKTLDIVIFQEKRPHIWILCLFLRGHVQQFVAIIWSGYKYINNTEILAKLNKNTTPRNLITWDISQCPANMERWYSVGLMLDHRPRRGANIKPALI